MADQIEMEGRLADVGRLAAVLEKHLANIGQDCTSRDLETPEGRQEIMDRVDQAWALSEVIHERAARCGK